MKIDFFEVAEAFHNAGFKIIPVKDPRKPDGKRPLCNWKQYQQKQTLKDIKTLFNSREVGACAILTGQGIETIDIDLKYAKNGDFLSRLLKAICIEIPEVFNKLCLTETINGGYHLIYKTNINEGNQKLASRYTSADEQKSPHDKTRVLIETRGAGGFIVVPPSPGYKIIDNGFYNLPLLTNEQRNKIINVCRTFDETNEIFKTKAATPPEIKGQNLTTIEAFNEAHEIPEFLDADGWALKYQRGQNDYYIRPGKTAREGVGACYNNELKLFYCFTSSTIFEPSRAYNCFQVYAVLHHNGDQKAAARELYRNGYGERMKTENKSEFITTGSAEQKEKIINTDILESVFNKKFDVNKPPAQIDYNLFCINIENNKPVNIASFGDIVTIVGAAKSRKSALTAGITAALLQDHKEFNPVLNFNGVVNGRNIVFLDTEQSAPDFYRTQKQILSLANINGNAQNLHSFLLTDIDMSDRLAFVEYIFKKIDNIGVLIIDGIVDLIEDYNDQKQSRQLIDYFKKIIAKNNALFIPVLHNARSTGSARGHLGTELINKSKAVIKIEKNNESGNSTVSFEYLRGSREPLNFDIWHDANGNLQVENYI
jgi:hypothetical protein